MNSSRFTLILLLVVLLATFGLSQAQAQRIYFTAGGQEIDSSNPGSVERVNADGSGLTTLIALPPNSRPTGLELDLQNGHIYWNDWNFRLTQRANLDGSGVVSIQSHPSSGLTHLALDVAGNKIYTTSGAGFRRVSRFNLDGTGSFQVIDSGFFPDGIDLDLASGHVYWGDGGISPTGIRRVDLNGANPVQLISPVLFPPTNSCSGAPNHGRGRGMALDLAAGKMYFGGHPRLPDLFGCPFGLGEIWVANLDGSGLQLLVGGLEKVADVALDLGAGKIYWTDARAGKIQRANLDGSNVQDVVTGVPTPHGLALELDSDGDGVLDQDDLCPNTVIPESVPTVELGVNRWALVDGDTDFDTTPPPGVGPNLSFTVDDTAGCSCEQIIAAQGLGKGHTKFGCSISAMQDWIALVQGSSTSRLGGGKSRSLVRAEGPSDRLSTKRRLKSRLRNGGKVRLPRSR